MDVVQFCRNHGVVGIDQAFVVEADCTVIVLDLDAVKAQVAVAPGKLYRCHSHFQCLLDNGEQLVVVTQGLVAFCQLEVCVRVHGVIADGVVDDTGSLFCTSQLQQVVAVEQHHLGQVKYRTHQLFGRAVEVQIELMLQGVAEAEVYLGLRFPVVHADLGVQRLSQLEGLVDLLFLDIQMPELNGLEFSKMVDSRTRIVFTTAFGQYAIDGYRVNALDYLLKPISYVDFLQAANKALQWFELVQKPEEIDSIFVKSDYKLVQVDLKKIMYIEGLKDYIKIYTEDAPKPILSLMSMKAMEELLPSSRFIRVHRSFIVQKDKIRVIDRGRIVFDKTYIPISDSYKQVFQTFLDERS